MLNSFQLYLFRLPFYLPLQHWVHVGSSRFRAINTFEPNKQTVNGPMAINYAKFLLPTSNCEHANLHLSLFRFPCLEVYQEVLQKKKHFQFMLSACHGCHTHCPTFQHSPLSIRYNSFIDFCHFVVVCLFRLGSQAQVAYPPCCPVNYRVKQLHFAGNVYPPHTHRYICI